MCAIDFFLVAPARAFLTFCLAAFTCFCVAISVVAQGVDELVLVHLRPALDADLTRAFDEVGLRPVVVAARLATPAANRRPGGVGRSVRDAGCLLLARAIAAKRFVLLLILDLCTGHGRLHPLETVDDLLAESLEVVRLAARDEYGGAGLVDVYLFVHPRTAGVSDVGLQA